MPGPANEAVPSLYVHVPFCAHKCAYCAFYSEASSGEVINRYLDGLVKELELVAERLRPRTIFFGGGTPSILNLRQWEKVFQTLERLGLLRFAGSPELEFTVECNPATVSLDKARLFRAHGVNRISMGVQSLNARLLERLGRIHTREAVFKSYEVLRRAGFENVNVDLMFGIPGQSLEVWHDTLREALALGSEHVSCYEVIYEEDTPLYAQLQAGEFEVDEELACAMYDELLARASEAGLRQYEIANFARDGKAGSNDFQTANSREWPRFACWHNINYWRGGSFLGAGPSATSYAGGVRWKNVSNTALYCEQLEAGRLPIGSREQLAPLARAGETAAFGLRMVAGWPFDRFSETTGHDLRREWAPDMAELSSRGWGEVSADRFRLTLRGLRFADAAAEFFLR